MISYDIADSIDAWVYEYPNSQVSNCIREEIKVYKI
jgi:hypothetical protein